LFWRAHLAPTVCAHSSSSMVTESQLVQRRTKSGVLCSVPLPVFVFFMATNDFEFLIESQQRPFSRRSIMRWTIVEMRGHCARRSSMGKTATTPRMRAAPRLAVRAQYDRQRRVRKPTPAPGQTPRSEVIPPGFRRTAAEIRRSPAASSTAIASPTSEHLSGDGVPRASVTTYSDGA